MTNHERVGSRLAFRAGSLHPVARLARSLTDDQIPAAQIGTVCRSRLRCGVDNGRSVSCIRDYPG